MFCINCGKEIKDNAKFCVFCGCVQKSRNRGQINTYTLKELNDVRNFKDRIKNILIGLTFLDVCIIGIYIAILCKWGIVFVSNMKYMWETFGDMEKDIRLLIMILFAIPAVSVVSFSVMGIKTVKRGEYHISLGMMLVVIGMVMKLGSYIFANVAWDSVLFIATIIFMFYGSIGIFTVIMSGINCILLHSKAGSARFMNINEYR